MIQKVKKFILVSIASLSIMMPGLLVPALSGVASASITTEICSGANNAANDTGNCAGNAESGAKGLTNLFRTLVKWFSIIVGAVSVIMIIYGGFRYITSGGDSGRVGNAKNTLLYAVIGLFIVAIAQLIVHFVIGTAGQAGNDFNS